MSPGRVLSSLRAMHYSYGALGTTDKLVAVMTSLRVSKSQRLAYRGMSKFSIKAAHATIVTAATHHFLLTSVACPHQTTTNIHFTQQYA